jgi:hypothetical protein
VFSQDQVCATVWVVHVMGKESQPFVVESLLVDTRRIAHCARLPKQMSQYVVVCCDKEVRALFKVTPPILNRFAYGQSFQIVRVGVAALSSIHLTRPKRDWLKSSSLVLQQDSYNPRCRSICSHGEHRVRADLRTDHAWRGNEP